MTPTARFTRNVLAASGLALLLACGGGGGGGGSTTPPAPVYASSLDYTAGGTGTFQLIKNTSKSSGAHLVLDLVGPTGTSLSGVGFYLTTDPTRVTWTLVDSTDADKVQNVAFNSSQLIVKTKVSSTGDTFQAGVYQKGTTAAYSTSGGTTLARVAMDLKPGLNLAQNTPITFTAVSGKAVQLNAPGSSTPTTPITIAAGSVIAK